MIGIADRVWDFWRETAAEFTEPEVTLLFSSGLPQEEVLKALAQAASDAVRALEAEYAKRPDPEEASTGHWSLAVVTDGVALRIDEEPDDFEGLLQRIAEGLEAQGVEGSFDLYEPTVIELPNAVDFLECRIRVHGERYHIRYRNYGWLADESALERAVGVALGWCVGNGANLPLQLVVGLIDPTILGPNDDVTALMRSALERTAGRGAVTHLTSVGPDRFRTLAVEPSTGRITLVEGGEAMAGAGWRATLKSVREALRTIAPFAVYGFVKRGSHLWAAEYAQSLVTDWVPVPHFEPTRLGAQTFEDEFAPDAFGLQLLGPGYRGRVPSGADWKAEALAPDTVLLEHVDAEAWFAERFVPFGGREKYNLPPFPPVPRVLADAREAFDAILYRDDVRVEP
jgi:hypothetical protein